MCKVFSYKLYYSSCFSKRSHLYETKIINYANFPMKIYYFSYKICYSLTEPILGITVYELVKLGGQITVNSNTDYMSGYRIATQNSSLAGLLLTCGCLYRYN